MVERRTTNRAILVTVAFYLVYQAFFALYMMPRFKEQTGYDVPDAQFGYSFREIFTQIDNWGTNGMVLYRYFEVLDLIFPLVYGTMLTLLLVRVISALDAGKRLRLLVFVPLLAVLVDYFENLGIFVMLWRHPNDYELVAEITSTLTMVKYGLIALSVLLIVFGGLGLLYRKFAS